MPSLCDGNGKAGIHRVKAAQTGVNICGLNGFEGKGKCFNATEKTMRLRLF